MYRYRLVEDENGSHVAAVIDGQLFSATDRHAGYPALVAALRNGEPTEVIRDLFDATQAVARRFEALSERVTLANGRLYFDGDLIHNSLTEQVLRFIDEGIEDWRPLVNFFEKVSLNPNDHSREQLFDWLDRHSFAIAPDGDFLAYKGVRLHSGDKAYESISSGPAVVNGVPHSSGPVPQSIGDVVEIARSRVVHNPSVGCASGLHVGDFSYANSFGPVLLQVKVNPRDVVSVPTDCEWRKMRVSRYKVVDVLHGEYTSAVWNTDDEDFEPEDFHSGL